MHRTIFICVALQLAGILQTLVLAGTPDFSSFTRPQLLEERLQAIDHELEELARVSLRSGIGTVGYRSLDHPDADHSEWIEVDWGEEILIDQVVMVPTLWRDTKTGFRADGFPIEFQIIAGTAPDTNGTVVATFDKQELLLPRIAPLAIDIPPTQASWIRVHATTLSERAWDGRYLLQLAELLVFHGGDNIALHQSVRTSTRGFGMAPPRRKESVVDGFMPYLMDAAEGEKSIAFASPPDIGDRATITLDLGEDFLLNRLHLHSVELGDTVPQTTEPGFGIPRHMVVEGARKPDFSDAISLVDYRMHSIFDAGPIIMRRFTETNCRYVRLTLIEPYIGTEDTVTGPQVGFAEIELFSNDQNVAIGVSPKTSFKAFRPFTLLTDGHNLYGKILPLRKWLNELARRHDLETERPFVTAELQLRYARQQTLLMRMGWLAGLLAAGIAFSILVVRFVHLRKLTRTKERFAADLHDELGANLHTIGLLSDLAEESKDDPEELSDFLQRIRTVTERTGIAVRHVADLQESDELFGGLTKDMQRAAERIVSKLEHDFSIKGEEHLDRLKPRTRVDLFLFYKECLINICRHSGATQLGTSVEGSSRGIRLIVSDNGRGMMHHLEQGIPASLKRRAKLMRAKVSIDSPAEGGTRINLTLKTRHWRIKGSS